MRIIALLCWGLSSLANAQIHLDLDAGLGSGQSNIRPLSHSQFAKASVHYFSHNIDKLAIGPSLAVREDISTLSSSSQSNKSMIRLDSFAVSLGLAANIKRPAYTIQLGGGALKSLSNLDINESTPSSNQMARLRKLPGYGTYISSAILINLRGSSQLKLGFDLQEHISQPPSQFSYKRTEVTGNGLQLETNSRGRQALAIPSRIQTRNLNFMIGLSHQI